MNRIRDATRSRRAFSSATESASAEQSAASTHIPGRSRHSAMAMQPEPVPKSRARGERASGRRPACRGAGRRSRARSTSSSVSGRGISTLRFTTTSKSRKGAVPQAYCTGWPLLTFSTHRRKRERRPAATGASSCSACRPAPSRLIMRNSASARGIVRQASRTRSDAREPARWLLVTGSSLELSFGLLQCREQLVQPAVHD